MHYATRINSFLRTGKILLEALVDVGEIDGVDYVDLNYPEHFNEYTVEEVKKALEDNGLKLNAINLRFRDDFLHGIFSNNNLGIREKSVKLSKEAAKVCEQLDGQQIIVWLPFDGYDYSFQINYAQVWNNIVVCMKDICKSTNYPVSIEYKPYEERVHAFLSDYGTTMLMIKDIDADNIGMTIDFCHMLMKKENPAFAANLLLEQGKLFTVHLNDGEGSTDDGLMIGAVHPWKVLELYYYLKKYDYKGIIYFDTFPKREDAVRECESNIRICKKFEAIIDKLGLDYIDKVIQSNDSVNFMEMIHSIL